MNNKPKIEVWNNIEKAFWDSPNNPEEILEQFLYGDEEQKRYIMVKFFTILDWRDILDIIPYDIAIRYVKDDKTIDMLFPDAIQEVYRNMQRYLRKYEPQVNFLSETKNDTSKKVKEQEKRIAPMQLNSNEINKIDTTELEIFKPDTKLAFFLAKKDKTDFIYNTSALEGNAMTYPEVQTLLEGITVGGHKLSDEQQILNQNKSVEYLFKLIESKTFKLDIDTFLKLHSFVTKEEALKWGVFRDTQVNIGGTDYEVPNADMLENIFNEGIKEIKKINHPIIRAITMFLFGAKCQFFYDGNKRTSRLMMNGILIKEGYPILNIKAKDKLEFNRMMINFYNNNDIIPSIKYLMDYYIKQNRKFVVENKQQAKRNTSKKQKNKKPTRRL